MKKLLSTCILLFVIAIFSLNAQTRVYPPTLSEPENEAIQQMPDVTLNWRPVTGVHGVVYYDVELDTDPDFSDPITFNTNLSAVVTSELTFNAIYYWRVRAIDGPDISDWSETWSFQVLNMLTLYRPNDNDTEVPPRQKFEWNTIEGVTHYDLQIDTDYFWKTLPDSTDSDLNDIYFTSGLNGWMVGAGGTIMEVDSFSVSEYASPTTNDLYGISFADASNGIAVGAGGVILYYDGTDWTEASNSPTSDDLNDVAFISDTDAWAVGIEGGVFHYDGTDWTAAGPSTSDDLFAVSFADASNGVITAKGAAYVYDGTDWTEMSAGSKELYGVYMLNANLAYACGKTGVIWKYDGSEWTEEDSPVNKDLFSIFFNGPAEGYAIGKEGNFVQYAGEWYKQSIGYNEQFNSIFFADNIGYTAANTGIALYSDGEGFGSMHNVYSRNADSGEYVVNFLHFGEKYFWRVRARHGKDTSAWSASRSVDIVANVELESPDDDAEEIGLSDEFSWKELDGVLTYEAQFADNENFSNPYIEFTEETSLIRNNLFFGTDYYWRVRANHATDTSDWSEEWHFTTINTVNLSSPANNATDIEILPTLVWEPITGVDMYQLKYDTIDLNNPCCDVLIEAPEYEYRVITPMVHGTNYQWHVRAIQGADTTEWSEAWNFTIEEVQGLGEMIDDTKVILYPNPSTGTVNIEYETQKATSMKISVLDLVGKVLLQEDLYFEQGRTTHSMDLSSLPNGIYIVRYTNGDQSFTRKITLH